MKITQLHFSLTSSLQKPHRPKISSNHSPISPNIFISSQAIKCFKSHQSNKRLKYYSTRNREPNEVINDKNIEILKQEFKKFKDLNAKSFGDSNQNSNKEVFNLIVKKYYKKTKLPSEFIDKKVKKQHVQKIVQQQIHKNTDYFQVTQQKNDSKTVNPQLKIQNQNAQQCPYQKEPSLIIQKRNRETISNYPRDSFPVTTKNLQRTIQIPSERLHRHRFNKSSITSLSHRNSFHQVNNFIVSKQQSPKKQLETNNLRSITSSRSQRNKKLPAKRFIKTTNTGLTQNYNGQKINPYTQQQYLHMKLKEQKEKFKTLQKFLNTSFIESNMTKSFLVKTITPKVQKNIIDKTDKKYVSMKEGFFKKARNHSLTVQNKRMQKSLNQKNKNDQLLGWDISQKVVQDQYIQII